MFRKNLLILSLIGLAALIAWGVAPGNATTACASATATANCALQLTVSRPQSCPI